MMSRRVTHFHVHAYTLLSHEHFLSQRFQAWPVHLTSSGGSSCHGRGNMGVQGKRSLSAHISNFRSPSFIFLASFTYWVRIFAELARLGVAGIMPFLTGVF